MSNSGASVNKYTCSGCGADLVFNPEKGVLKCEYCGAEQVIVQAGQQLEERSYEQYINNSQARLEKLSQTALEVNCDDCGANITFEPPQVAGSCPFCAAKIVAQPKIADPAIAPEGIIPFTIGRQQARQNLQKWLKSIWFAPNDLQKLAQTEKIQGVYLPFWTYDAQTTSRYRGERGDYYYVTETYTETNSEGKQETKTREVRHTRWSSASGVVHCTFDDLLVPATTLVDRDRLQELEPWQLKESLRPYEPSYLAGFEAQRAQVSLEAGLETAKGMMSSRIDSAVRSHIGGDDQRVSSVSTDYRNITFKHLLLPVWMTAYRYQNKRYQVMINARTGEVQGARPYSTIKIILAVLGGLAVVGVIIGIIMLLANK